MVSPESAAVPSDDADLVARARRWAATDPDPATRAAALDLADGGDAVALAEAFGSTLQFGTAGLRGRLGPGPNRMNRAVVRRAASGFAHWLVEQRLGEQRRGEEGAVVVGRDARHGSADFASDSARVFAAAGLRVTVLERPVPTPVLAFAIRHLDADAGVMVTASHNPAIDNGYKVYLGDGAQIIPPVDAEIAAAIDAAPPADAVELAPADDPRIATASDGVEAAYLAFAAGLVDRVERRIRIVYTPMHGVGGALATEVLARAGFTDVSVVPEQAEPDPDFPTVAFPNPEEPGALDLATARADATGADLVLANDPDADRLGVAVPTADGWRRLRGDEVGWLLGADILDRTSGSDRLVVTTIVSDDLLGDLAAEAGVEYRRTLTGFKWVVRPALDDPALRFVFGYEEALGYSVAETVRDKDGITAALALADLADRLAATNRTLLDRIDELERNHGVHHGRSAATRFEGPEGRGRMAAVMTGLRATPPAELAGVTVTRVVDYEGDTGLAPADVVQLELGADRLVVRPSGTEPKLKLYVHTVEPVTGAELAPSRERAATRAAALLAAIGDRLGLA